MSLSLRRTAPVPGGAALVGVRLPSTTVCGCFLIVVVALLRLFGFVRAVRSIRRMTRSIPLAKDSPHEVAESVAKKVALVAAFYPGHARCLEQSLTLYWLLRRMELDAALQFGVQPVSFAAHAWVEYHGVPVFEGELVATVHPFPELPI